MCGIAGLLHLNSTPANRNALERMNQALTPRGPDASGIWCEGNVGLAHRRLSIIDLASGAQPMQTEDGRFTLTFNGEIYNFQKIRKDLEAKGIVFRTHSDTEVILQAYALFGAGCLDLLDGMFAFAIWDSKEKKLFAARDRMGKKPFYYWSTASLFAFASEPKSFLTHPEFSKKINFTALSQYLQYEYVPSPLSIYENVHQLPAGHYLTVENGKISTTPYWDIPLGITDSNADFNQSQKQILNLLDAAVSKRLMSEVPLGVFLSGGIDSSAVVALMARHREGKDIQTFSIGFEEASFDETAYAALVAKQFKTSHHHQTLSAQKMLEILTEVTGFLDEPFADPSILPTYLLSKFTKQNVTVALGGDGGDELFAGYPTFVAEKAAGIFQKIPKPIQSLIRKTVSKLPVSHRNMSFDFLASQFLYGASFPAIHRAQVWLGSFHHQEQWTLLTPEVARQTPNPLERIDAELARLETHDFRQKLLYFYQKFYLCGDILTKVDRASMAASLEVRAPFLDRELVEFVSKLPYHFKLRGKTTKAVLKKTLEGLLPNEILYRPKKGFGIPVSAWLQTSLRDRLQKQLAPAKIKKEGLFNSAVVDQLVGEHLSGKRNHRKKLWALLMFEEWRENFFD